MICPDLVRGTSESDLNIRSGSAPQLAVSDRGIVTNDQTSHSAGVGNEESDTLSTVLAKLW